MRVYVPVTPAGLRALVESGGLGPPPIIGYAVTGPLREWYAAGDEEEMEYAAMTLAAQAALRSLAAADDHQMQRMVLAVDTGNATPDESQGRGAVMIDAAVAHREVVAVHADTAEAEADVTAAVAVLRAGGPRDDDEQFVVDSCDAHELAWFATQEVGDLLS